MTTRPPDHQLNPLLPVEIERKYLLRGMPELPKDQGIEVWRIEQGYLPAIRGEAQAKIRPFDEGRLRRLTREDGSVQYYHTIKRGTGLVRHEFEIEITPEQFNEYWPRTTGMRLRKTRLCVPDGSLVWEIDVFDGIDLVLAEIELPRRDTVITIPSWLSPHVVREVTEEPAYTNSSIARRLA